jgi:diguanylate cyclase (GGDEF)-like protein
MGRSRLASSTGTSRQHDAPHPGGLGGWRTRLFGPALPPRVAVPDAELDPLAAEIKTVGPAHTWQLRLPPRLEAAFQAESQPLRTRHLRVTAVMAFLALVPFLPLHLILMPDAWRAVLILQLGIQVPLIVFGHQAIAWNLPTVYRESIATTLALLCALMTMLVCARSQSPLAEHCIYGVGLVVMFSNVVQQVRFRYALCGTIAIVALSALPLCQPPNASAGLRLWLPVHFGYLGLFTLFCSHQIERGERAAWLDGMRERIDGQRLTRANRDLREISGKDPLTGLPNRRTFDAALARALGQSNLPSQALAGIAVMMLDVDFFKRFNDHYGHVAGDACLREVGRVLGSQIRGGTDTVARYGGEEFVAVLPGLDRPRALARAEQLRRAVEALAIPHADAPAGIVTVSVGVTVGFGPALSAEALTAAADAALYEAKRQGRNTVRIQLDPGGPAADSLAATG